MVLFVLYSKNDEIFVRKIMQKIIENYGINVFYLHYDKIDMSKFGITINPLIVFHNGDISFISNKNYFYYHLRGFKIRPKVAKIQIEFYSKLIGNDLKRYNVITNSGLQTTSDMLKIASLVVKGDDHQLVEHGYGSPEVIAAAIPDLNLILSNIEEYSGCPMIIVNN